MPPAFSEAWDLLMSDISKDCIQLLKGQPLASTSPSNISPNAISATQPAFVQARPAVERNVGRTPPTNSSTPPSTHKSKDKDTLQNKETTRRQESNPETSVAQSTLRAEGGSDVAKRLQDLRRELKLLQDSGFPRDNEDPQTVSAFRKKLELLTDAVLSIAPQAELTKKRNYSGGSSSDDTAQDLRCWDSCCGGRKFSTKSNMIRHRRERSGQVGKSCSLCNAYFTRRSVRNAHEANRICRPARGNHAY